jgi:glucose-1-phosphate cytidylyltransferase
MVEIGGKPILWHIMMHYHHYGFNDFVIALGYKGDYIKKWAVDYCSLSGNISVNVKRNKVSFLDLRIQDITIDLIDTGLATLTGGRIKRLAPYLDNSTFFLTWGDGVSTVDLRCLLEFHRSHGKLATVTAVHPPSRFGQLELDGDEVGEFSEKPLDKSWINGAFFVLEPGVFDYIEGDHIPWEKEPMMQLAKDRQLMAYRHEGFWQCMDTLRDKVLLEELWQNGQAPWKLWE